MVSISMPEANWAARPGYSPGKISAEPGWPGPRRPASAATAPSAAVAPARAAFASARARSSAISRHSARTCAKVQPSDGSSASSSSHHGPSGSGT